MAKDPGVRSPFTNSIALLNSHLNMLTNFKFRVMELQIFQLIVLRSNLGILDIGTFVSAWKPSRQRIDDGKYTEKI